MPFFDLLGRKEGKREGRGEGRGEGGRKWRGEREGGREKGGGSEEGRRRKKGREGRRGEASKKVRASTGERRWRNRGEMCDKHTKGEVTQCRVSRIKASNESSGAEQAVLHMSESCQWTLQVSKVRQSYKCPLGNRHKENTFFFLFLIQKKKEMICFTCTDCLYSANCVQKLISQIKTMLAWTLQSKQSCWKIIML